VHSERWRRTWLCTLFLMEVGNNCFMKGKFKDIFAHGILFIYLFIYFFPLSWGGIRKPRKKLSKEDKKGSKSG